MDAKHEDAERFVAEVPTCRAITCCALGDTSGAARDTLRPAAPPTQTP